ncbi:VWA domain-containing protein [Treponema brennaborense]|uniref:von Willebrand factor type A n=1 Tax=Treponema brennaborense (strain DSM 12168 / CIP 105900 / DD5/3) TaxID=906968 RepID=F4LK48_TREBD|nr:VWA domain-containing protein [Treponema brennaborense]AEE17510.1 von Willebrand factor type A [Treponema brennaborense DSM 12168]
MLAFQHPVFFLFLPAIPLLFVLRRTGIFNRPAFPLVLGDWNASPFEWKYAPNRIASAVSRILCIAGYCAVVAALASPVVMRQEKVYTAKGSEILFVLDVSPSMAAKDIAGMSRLEAAKQAVRVIVPEAGGTAFGLVALASEAALMVPPTLDREAFFARLNSLQAGELGDGSAIGMGVSTAAYHLISSAAPKKSIVLITDGENNAGSVHPGTAAQLAFENGITLYVLGVGTRGSVPLEYVDPATGKTYSGYLDSRFDESPLQEIALTAGGRYFGVESMGELTAAVSAVTGREQTVQSFYLKNVEDSYYDRLLLAAGICFACAWLIRRLYLKELI